jgi:hypothetical protein
VLFYGDKMMETFSFFKKKIQKMPTDNTFLSGLSAKPGDSFFLFYLNRKKKKKGEEKE